MSWVAAVKPIANAPSAVMVSDTCGSNEEVHSSAATTANWAASSQARRRPSAAVSQGIGSRSTSGAHTNLKEKPIAAQLKNVIVARSTPASRNHTDSVPNMSSSGSPAENPRNSIVTARGCTSAAND